MADYKAIKLIKNGVEYCFPSGGGGYDGPRLDIFLLGGGGGGGGVGNTNSSCYGCSGGGGAGEFVIYYGAEVSLGEHTIVVGAGGAGGAANANGGKGGCSCFDDKRADGGGYGAGGYYNGSNNGGCSHGSGGGRSGGRCDVSGCPGLGNTSNSCSFAGGGAGGNAASSTSSGYEGGAAKTTDFTGVYKRYGQGGQTLISGCCAPRDANTGDGGHGSCQCNCPGGAGGSGFVAVRYPIDGSYCISSSTGGTCSQVNICGTCYCVHCFTSSGTLTIS